MTTPIYDALSLVRNAVRPALQALTSAVVYWQEVAEGAALPAIVVQSQDQGGQAELYLSGIGWSGQITVKALTSSSSATNGNAAAAAEELIATVAPGMENVAAPVGYALSISYLRPVLLPPIADVYQTGHTWNVRLERA